MDPAQYAELFLAESREHLGTLNQQLLVWERNPKATEPVVTLFRAVHTIKGMAATMGYAVVANIAHRVENLLDLLRQRRKAVPADTLDLLFQSADALEQAVERSVLGEEDTVDATELLRQLDQTVLALEPSKPKGKRPVPKEPSEQPDFGGRGIRVVIRPDAPLKGVRALLVLRNLAPLGAVLKPSAATEELMVHRGRAVVFEDIDDYKARIDTPDLDINPDDIMVLKNCGPRGYPGDVLPQAMRAGHGERSIDLAMPVAAAVGDGDVVMVKGSLGSRMAAIVAALHDLDTKPAPLAASNC